MVGTMRAGFTPFLGGHALDDHMANNSKLEWLMQADAAPFWDHIRRDPSLYIFLTTFIRHATRPFDDPFPSLSGAELALWRNALAVIHKM
jgi:hypothetical protein